MAQASVRKAANPKALNAKPRVLVTGAPGWLGTSLTQAIAAGTTLGPVQQSPEPVRILAAPGVPLGPLAALENVDVVTADLRHPLPAGVCDGIDTVVHCAGLIHPHKTQELFDINVLGTRHVLDAAISAGVRRLIFISSNSPAGVNLSPTQLMLEADPPRPYLAYGLSKLQAEWLVNSAHRAGQIETVILRPCWFYGPNQPLRQTTFFQMIRKGHPPVFGRGDNLRSMSYVDNTVQGVLLARDVPQAAGQTYWIADRRPYSWIEILETVARILEVQIAPRYLPRLTSDMCRLADSLLQMAGLYQQELHVAGELAASIAVSIDKAATELGYAPTIELEEGMRRSIDWCRGQGVQI